MSVILPTSGKALLLGTCLLLFRDAYPVNTTQGAVYQDVKVELCEDDGAQHIVVRGRLYQDIATQQGYEEREIRDWEVIRRHVLTRPEGAGP